LRNEKKISPEYRPAVPECQEEKLSFFKKKRYHPIAERRQRTFRPAEQEATMTPLDTAALDQLFVLARTHLFWQERPVEEDTLHRLYDLMKYGPTSTNTTPARIVFVRTPEQKARLVECVSDNNREKVRTSPVTAIIAQDMEFYRFLPKLRPGRDVRSWFEGKPDVIAETAFRNSTLQGAYFILAVRALGLDAGPMGGFDEAKVDAAFLAGTSWKSNFLCNIGYGIMERLRPRAPRLLFDEACRIV
jgi:3-hydroxypropanoate dehydrogenase